MSSSRSFDKLQVAVGNWVKPRVIHPPADRDNTTKSPKTETRGVNSSAAPGLRIEVELEFCLPQPPRRPQGGWKVMKTGQQGLDEMETPRERAVDIFSVGDFFADTREGIPGPALLITSSDQRANYTAGQLSMTN
ncbi:unnamed protein product [Pleuronectes platessa]|uniref:Uncharacterized protein n=1 Tax=Pleuronectes platessa TaxID=8262 RepID=A0A9N7VCL5_PLEPL|nr:unnamed protein product [Pleuronectes platessa]